MSGEHKANNPDEARRAERIFFKKKEGEKRMDRIEHERKWMLRNMIERQD